MGNVNVHIALRNSFDVGASKRGLIKETEIRQTSVDALVDTGAITLVINQELFRKLGLLNTGERETSFANNEKTMCIITEPVEISWENRVIAVPAIVVEDAPMVLLGVLPLEGMDVKVDPVNQKLVGVHGERLLYNVI